MRILRARRSDGRFYPAVIERFGAFGNQLVGLIKMLTGDGDRDPLADDDYVFATRSRTTYLVSHLCFTTVIADAYMMDAFMSHDVSGRPLGGASAAPPPGPWGVGPSGGAAGPAAWLNGPPGSWILASDVDLVLDSMIRFAIEERWQK